MTLVVKSELFTRWAMGKRNMVVGNVIEEVDLLLVQQKPGGDRVYGSIAPAFIEEASVLVQLGEEVDIGIGPQPVQVPYLEVGPLK